MPATEERRTRDAERTRRVILDAAESLFAARGYGGTSLQDVGDAAGVSRGTPSYFFGSKEGLYRAVLRRNFSRVGETLRRIRDEARGRGEKPAEVLRLLIEGYLDFLIAHPTFVRLVQWEAINGGEVLDEMAPRLALAGEMEEVAREAVRGGSFRPIDARQLILSIIALCWFPLSEKDSLLRLMEADPFSPAFAEQRKRHVVDLVLNGICARPPG